jgi:hypothetical protein
MSYVLNVTRSFLSNTKVKYTLTNLSSSPTGPFTRFEDALNVISSSASYDTGSVVNPIDGSSGGNVTLTFDSTTIAGNSSIDLLFDFVPNGGTFPPNGSWNFAMSFVIKNGVSLVPGQNITSSSDQYPPVIQPCLAQGTLVQVIRGGIRTELPIEQLRSGDQLCTASGRQIPLLQNVRLPDPSTRFVCIERSALGHKVPSMPVMIRRGHPLLIGGREVMSEQLLEIAPMGVRQVELDQAKPIYTLVTENRAFVNMSGLFVATWSAEAWSLIGRAFEYIKFRHISFLHMTNLCPTGFDKVHVFQSLGVLCILLAIPSSARR